NFTRKSNMQVPLPPVTSNFCHRFGSIGTLMLTGAHGSRVPARANQTATIRADPWLLMISYPLAKASDWASAGRAIVREAKVAPARAACRSEKAMVGSFG